MKTSKESHTHTHTHTPIVLEVPIFIKLYDFYKKLSESVVSFPKTQRYTLGQKLENITLEILELLFSIPNSESKIVILQRISIKLDLLKILLRLSKDTSAVRENKYIELQSYLQEVGKMLGGWIKSAKQNPLK